MIVETPKAVPGDQAAAPTAMDSGDSKDVGWLSCATLIGVNVFVAAASVPLYRRDLRDTVWTDPSSIFDGAASVGIRVGLWALLSLYVWTSIAALTAILNRNTSSLRPIIHLYFLIAAIHFGAFGLGACLNLIVGPPSPPDPSVIF